MGRWWMNSSPNAEKRPSVSNESRVVPDASALLALLEKEPGAERVGACVEGVTASV